MKFRKIMTYILCLGMFGLMAAGSSSSESSSEDKKTISDVSVEDSKEVTIDEQVLLNQNDIVITAIEYSVDKIWGDGVKLLIENNTDKNITLSCDALIVNGYMNNGLFVADVSAGKKSNETMYLSNSELEGAGIDRVGEIEAYFNIYESTSYKEICETDGIIIKTSEYENMETTPNDMGKELYNEGGIKIVGKTVDENSFWGAGILLYIENNSGENICVQCDDVSVNGFMMSPLFSCEVYSEKKAIDEITIFSSDLEDNGIESIDNVELKFHIYNIDTYETINDSDTISFSSK